MCVTSVSLSFAHIIVTKYNLCFLLSVAFYLYFSHVLHVYPVPRLIDAASFRHNDDAINCAIARMQIYKAPNDESLRDPLYIPNPCSNLYFILYSLHHIRRTVWERR